MSEGRCYLGPYVRCEAVVAWGDLHGCLPGHRLRCFEVAGYQANWHLWLPNAEPKFLYRNPTGATFENPVTPELMLEEQKRFANAYAVEISILSRLYHKALVPVHLTWGLVTYLD